MNNSLQYIAEIRILPDGGCCINELSGKAARIFWFSDVFLSGRLKSDCYVQQGTPVWVVSHHEM